MTEQEERCEQTVKWEQRGRRRKAKFGRGHLCIKFPKIQTAERQAETDGLCCGREERKCQNSVREEMEAWRLWSVKRDRSQAERKKKERTCQRGQKIGEKPLHFGRAEM